MKRKGVIGFDVEIIHARTLSEVADRRKPITEIHFPVDSLYEYSESYIIIPGHPLPEGKAVLTIVPLDNHKG